MCIRDRFARALLVTEKIFNESDFLKLFSERYASFEKGEGNLFTNNKLSLDDLYRYAKKIDEPEMISGRQEYLENLINRYIF